MHKPFNNNYIWYRVVFHPDFPFKSPGELSQNTTNVWTPSWNNGIRTSGGAGAEHLFVFSQSNLAYSIMHQGCKILQWGLGGAW